MKNLLATGLFLTLASHAQALPITVYSNDFESDASGFSDARISDDTAVDGTGLTDFHGTFFFGDATVLSLDLSAFDHTMVALSFDLYLFSSWDGSATSSGPDSFTISGDVSFDETFTNHRTEGQSFAGLPSEVYGTGLGSTQVYRGLGPSSDASEFVVAHSADTFSVTFAGVGLSDEWWGIDNVEVSVNAPTAVVPLPAGFLLLGTAIALLGFSGRSRRDLKSCPCGRPDAARINSRL